MVLLLKTQLMQQSVLCERLIVFIIVKYYP